jgi:hypothetical protein
VTVPVGVVALAPEAAVTVATILTGSPWVVLCEDSANATWLDWLGWLTVSVTALELEAAYVALPP